MSSSEIMGEAQQRLSAAGQKVKRFNVKKYLKPLLPFVPEVATPERRVPVNERMLWTVLSLLIFLVCSQIPLYGLQGAGKGNDPLYWLRTVMASNRGTLMELGIAPLVTTSMIIQFLQGSGLMQNFDDSLKEDRLLNTALQKVSGVVYTAIIAASYVSSGMYGDVAALGSSNVTLIVAQLTIAGAIVVMLDEIMQKGYGIGSGVSLFMTVNICETIAWKLISFQTIQTPYGPEYEGAIPAFFYQLVFSNNKLLALWELFYRPYGANGLTILVTAIVFCVIVYFQSFRIDVPVKSLRVRGQTGNYPIKLFYTSSMPIILHSALVSNYYFFSQMMYRRFKGSMFVGLFGVWQELDYTGEAIPVAGLAYYLSPPMSMWQMVSDPIRLVIYIGIYLTTVIYLSQKWIYFSGESPRDVSNRLKQQQLTIVGYRDVDALKVLQRNILPAAGTGALVIALITLGSDVLGCIGSGTGILLAVTSTYSMYETAMKDPEMARAFSGMNMASMMQQ